MYNTKYIATLSIAAIQKTTIFVDQIFFIEVYVILEVCLLHKCIHACGVFFCVT